MAEGRAHAHEGRVAGRERGAGSLGSAADPGRSASAAGRAPRRRRKGTGSVDDGIDTPGTAVAGYRLVRLIGRGTRCEVHLARPSRPAASVSGTAGNVAVKIVPATERSRGEAEIVALQAVTSEHVVALRDVATLADGSLCIVQSIGQRGTASALVARRGSITPGETVTLVASVLRGLGDLHEAGIAHGAVDLTHVVLDATGRPMLSGLGSSRAVAGETTADAPPGVDPVEQDLGRVSRIVQALRDPADARGRTSEDRWDRWLALLDAAVHREADLTAHDLADRLLDVADAAPLADAGAPMRSREHGAVMPPNVAIGAISSGPLDGAAPGTATSGRGRSLFPRATRRGHRRHRAESTRRAGGEGSRGTAARARLTSELGAVRPRVWALGASALLLLLAGVVAVPALTGPAHGATASPTNTSTPSTAAPLSTGVDVTPATDAAADADADATSSPDPDVAAPALLRLRASCLRHGDMGCLDAVDEAGSAVEDADRTALASTAAADLDDAALHVADARAAAQRMGDSALIGLTPEVAAGSTTPGRRPASLLIVRGEAGWRIRDLMDDR
ncbi:serine/threonine protein kinase [Clavibacter sp. VKM Ac-2873]|uniref:protein kinase domain-containing protein n=1 Tax=Clavibacter sp. VKM Ac-2873 TaxID=2783813 RepID=UPI00188A9526|nr:protein kinase [Clavibacter sp. VKM Ac-2873]MBF4616675.1 serine/threonine protein kinase [Clavibacter sp. VKM Ac-2873]